ncbi:hypothetical protein AG0111_0g12990 [Alternaria gaisen]|uniref:Uncharacterized protein n=1 Tax=Alternaria gaisen TaxID=167740 RepID=A0ACB6F2R9_9PLEO|nr:hypothetical protein AG0111_0g12990 [Alternaria gaisen]
MFQDRSLFDVLKSSPLPPPPPHDRDRSSSPEVAPMALKRSDDLTARISLCPAPERDNRMGPPIRVAKTTLPSRLGSKASAKKNTRDNARAARRAEERRNNLSGQASAPAPPVSSSHHSVDGTSPLEDATSLPGCGTEIIAFGPSYPMSLPSSFFRELRLSLLPASYTILPQGWYRARDENDSTYFYTACGEAQWARPTQPASMAVSTERKREVQTAASSSSDIVQPGEIVVPPESSGNNQSKEGLAAPGNGDGDGGAAEEGEGGEVAEEKEDGKIDEEAEVELEIEHRGKEKDQATAAEDHDKSAYKGKGKEKVLEEEQNKYECEETGDSERKRISLADNLKRKHISLADYQKRKQIPSVQESGLQDVRGIFAQRTVRCSRSDTNDTIFQEKIHDNVPSTINRPSILGRRNASESPPPARRDKRFTEPASTTVFSEAAHTFSTEGKLGL